MLEETGRAKKKKFVAIDKKFNCFNSGLELYYFDRTLICIVLTETSSFIVLTETLRCIVLTETMSCINLK